MILTGTLLLALSLERLSLFPHDRKGKEIVVVKDTQGKRRNVEIDPDLNWFMKKDLDAAMDSMKQDQSERVQRRK